MKRALITGINGQDGYYLSEFLLLKGYKVYGMSRTGLKGNHLNESIICVAGNLTDKKSLIGCLEEVDPDEVYNLGGISSVGASWQAPEYTNDINGVGVLRLLDAIKNYNKSIKFYQASTSEMYGKPLEAPQNEATQFHPRSPYGVSKLFGHCITRNYRESYGMFACSGILFNHESERRPEKFVTRKISKGVAKIYLGLEDHLVLGNIDGRRDWGYAPDFVEAMWLILQQEQPDDYVIATEKINSIRNFLAAAFECVNIRDWEKYIRYDERYMRPLDVDNVVGDCTKAKKILGWRPKVTFEKMAEKMVMNDIALLRQDAHHD